MDREVDSLAIPRSPGWLYFVVWGLRWYRKRISRRLGHRCVYEPSCSRYAELAVRKYGLWYGVRLTLQRIVRCRPGYGGTDLP
ncbi:membrane protein insertion efficiency factor YidD [Candidatus Chloroploca sp. Khr17]|uniref:membrane protein insertion efficiency factor YidD n=1 Tax=Candidatus Chloroploca sp. Khr17 TaxID=2496869 RepID=UPI00101B8634